MNLTEWFIFAGMLLTLFGGLVATINALIKNQWVEHKELHRDIKEQLDDQHDCIQDIQIKVKGIETVCQLRQYPRMNDGA